MALAFPQTMRVALWPIALAGVLFTAVAALFFDTAQAMAQVWRSSESFAHGPLIPLATAWLVWRKRDELSGIALKPWWPALAPLAACGFAWLLANLAGVNTAEQFALVAMVPALVALVLGWRIAWAIAFPLAFLLFAVPFGTFMLPTLMDWTADFTVSAVRATGVPVLREGTSFTLPSGRWSVVESCSGIRYLLAAVPLSCLYAYLSYQTLRARTLFIALTVVVALVANWIRAYIIVMLGHVSGMKIAVGADHLVYGWLFFGIVMGITFWLGGFIRDPAQRSPRARESGGAAREIDADASGADRDAARRSRDGQTPSSPGAGLVAALAALALSAAWPGAATQLRAHAPVTIDLSRLADLFAPLAAPDNAQRSYRPVYRGDTARFVGVSRTDPTLGLAVFHYARQGEGSEMIHESNRPMPGRPDDSTWQVRARKRVDLSKFGAGAARGAANEYLIAGPDGLHLVWEWFQVDGKTLASPAEVKLHTARSMLLGNGDESLAWYLWAPVRDMRDDPRDRLAALAARLAVVPIRPGR
ncbi:MAG: exosortase A [Burkholderiaceae bacterium]|nr:exosortase A [Burkholderiaceae bacterium]